LVSIVFNRDVLAANNFDEAKNAGHFVISTRSENWSNRSEMRTQFWLPDKVEAIKAIDGLIPGNQLQAVALKRLNASLAQLWDNERRLTTEAFKRLNRNRLQALALRLHSTELSLARINSQFQQIQSELSKIEAAEQATSSAHQQWRKTANGFESLYAEVQNLHSKIKQQLDEQNENNKKCIEKFKANTKAISRLAEHVDTSIVLPPSVVSAIQKSQESAGDTSKFLNESTDTMNQAYDEIKKIDEKAKQVSDALAKLETDKMLVIMIDNGRLKSATYESEKDQQQYEQIKRNIEVLRKQREELVRLNIAAKTPTEAAANMRKIADLDFKIQQAQDSTLGLSMRVNNSVASIRDLQGSLTARHSELKTAYEKSAQSIQLFSADSIRLKTSLGNLNARGDSSAKAIANLCENQNKIAEDLKLSQAEEIADFEEKLEKAISSAPQGKDGLLAGFDTQKFKTKATTAEGSEIRYLWNRQAVIKSWSNDSLFKFNKTLLTVSEDLILAYDSIAAQAKIATEQQIQARATIHSMQNYAAGIFSFSLGFVPGVGTAKDIAEIATGVDIITGFKLSNDERALVALGMLLPVAGSAAKTAVKAVAPDLLTELAKKSGSIWDKVVTRAVELNKTGVWVKRSADELNAEWAQFGAEPAWMAGSYVYEVVLKQPVRLWRVTERTEDAAGKWYMKHHPTNFSKSELADSLALPGGVDGIKNIVEIEIPAGTQLLGGIAGPNKWGKGGGKQWYLNFNGDIPEDWVKGVSKWE